MIISSQSYLDYSVVDEKISQLQGSNSVTLPIVKAGELDGESIFILVDGHHRLEAAKELGIPVSFEEQNGSDWNFDSRWSLDDALAACWMDSEWENVETGKAAF